jgi:hypothetical protein
VSVMEEFGNNDIGCTSLNVIIPATSYMTCIPTPVRDHRGHVLDMPLLGARAGGHGIGSVSGTRSSGSPSPSGVSNSVIGSHSGNVIGIHSGSGNGTPGGRDLHTGAS